MTYVIDDDKDEGDVIESTLSFLHIIILEYITILSDVCIIYCTALLLFFPLSTEGIYSGTPHNSHSLNNGQL